MIRRTVSLALLGTTVAASLAWTQASVDPRVDARLSGRVHDVLVAMIDSAKREGLPTEPLIQKAFEGVGKGAPSGLIITAVRDYYADLHRARAALGPLATIADVEAGALALRNKIDVRYLERLRTAKSSGGTRIATALNVLSYISGKGVHPDTAANVITNLVLASASDDQLLSLKDDIERDIAGGVSAVLALSARGQGLTALIAAAQNNNGGAPSGTLPSGLGSTRPADAAGNAAVGGAAGAVSPGGSKPAPAGRPKKP